MRQTVLILLTSGCIFMFSCWPNKTLSDYRATVKSARSSIPVAVQMEKLFGDADHFITHYGVLFDNDTKLWNTEVFFGGRYTLTMQVDIDIDYGRNTVKLAGDPTFYLVGTTKVEVLPDGRVATSHAVDIEVEVLPDGRMVTSHKGSIQTSFGLAEWEKVYESGGDFTKIGIELDSTEVPGFDLAVQAERAPRVHIRLTDIVP